MLNSSSFSPRRDNKRAVPVGGLAGGCGRRGLLCGSAALLLLSLITPSRALAGGMGRLNGSSPLSLGIGGAGFAGVADPTTIHHNPAGLTLMPHTVAMGAVDLVLSGRSYEPAAGAPDDSELGIFPVPTIGVCSRFSKKGGERPLPISIGLGFYNTFGGAVSFDAEKVQPGISNSSLLLLELVPAVAYQINSRLALGLGLRIGFGLFSITNNERSGAEMAPASLSGAGTEVAVSAGGTFQALSWLRLGVVYGSPMRVEMQGDGDVEVNPGVWKQDRVTLEVPWPQWAALGAAARVLPSLELFGGIRWTDWSAFHELFVDLAEGVDVTQDLDFRDGVSVHLGAAVAVTPRFSMRGGFAYDSNTVPDRNVTRVYLDSAKLTAGVGATVTLTSLFLLDLGYELMALLPRTVPDEMAVVPETGASEAVNKYPGRYSWLLHSLSVGVRFVY